MNVSCVEIAGTIGGSRVAASRRGRRPSRYNCRGLRANRIIIASAIGGSAASPTAGMNVSCVDIAGAIGGSRVAASRRGRRPSRYNHRGLPLRRRLATLFQDSCVIVTHQCALFQRLDEWNEPLFLGPLNRIEPILIADRQVRSQLN